MKIIKKIYDFIAKRAKNLRKRPWVFHFWKHHCWENPSLHFGKMAEVEASELEEMCGYINPLYSGLVHRARDQSVILGEGNREAAACPLLNCLRTSRPREIISNHSLIQG